MRTINENIKAVVDKLIEGGLKITAISKGMGYTTTTQIYNAMDGKSNITSRALENFVANFNVKPEFLFTGKGPMFNEEPEKPKEPLEENCGFVIYNPDNNVYLGERDCFVRKLKTAIIYSDDIYAASVAVHLYTKYPDNPFVKNLVVKPVIVELR